MTVTAIEPGVPSNDLVPFDGLEVATVASDTLRASIRISGTLTVATVALVSSVLRTHLTAGRRYLRVDLTSARLADDAVATALVDSHRAVEELGGMLLFEGADASVAATLHRESLFVHAAGR